MPISLQKGGNVNLSKEAPGLVSLKMALGWDVRATDGAPFDLDAVVYLLNAAGKVREDKDFVFYNNLRSADGSVIHSGDNRTGGGDGDDEVVTIDLARVPMDVDRIALAVSIHEGDNRRQNFGMVGKAFIRCVDAASNSEIARYDLSEDGSTETAMIFGEVYRNGADWKFRAIGQGFAGGLAPLSKHYGVNV